MPALGRLGLQSGGSSDRSPQSPAFGVEARHQFQPALSLDPQLLQNRGFVGWDPPDFPRLDSLVGPLQQFEVLG